MARRQARTKHQGPLRVRATLRRRQIPEELAAAALRKEFPEGAEDERAVIALERLGPSRGALRPGGQSGAAGPDAERRKEAGRLFRRLVARGYSWGAARHAVLTSGRRLEADPGVDPEP